MTPLKFYVSTFMLLTSLVFFGVGCIQGAILHEWAQGSFWLLMAWHAEYTARSMMKEKDRAVHPHDGYAEREV